ncbi:hypothetical protein HNQ50_003363 [Silvimonas terrae]|uniref:Uncharacterized protein n=1 Tax=Silvimonas terrae TaxID=300266 RepID=A0A840RGA1_9NEIS|nr:hypothetical protein [Silvimonas terrae]MBB5192619.1 hypothetical protein [Silvimonas terrae]
MSFVIDGSEWNFNGWSSEDIIFAIDLLLERVEIAKNRKETIWIGDDLQTRSMLGDLDLWSLVAPDSPISVPPEIRQELAAWLGRASKYLDEPDWPHGMADALLIGVDGQAQQAENADWAWAHHHVRNGRPVACIGLRRSGVHDTDSVYGHAVVHWVVDENSHRAFWRDAIELEGDSQEALERLAPHAFPDLFFQANVWRGLNELVGGYDAERKTVQKYLRVLDDQGYWAFTCPPPALSRGEADGPDPKARPSNQIIERRFMGLALEVAPEKPNVHDDTRCREAREIVLGGRTLYCEWHGKLKPHQNRLHFHPPVPESGEKVIIAIFHRHLPLP